MGRDSMFDPTIYENLKVVIEGAVYDLDLAGVIDVTNRIDRVELSTMSRNYMIQFQAKEDDSTLGEIRLVADTKDLASEILEQEDEYTPGCLVRVRFQVKVENIEEECAEINKCLQDIWGHRPHIQQKVSYLYDSVEQELLLMPSYNNEISLEFGRKIDEGQIDDMRELIDLTLHSIHALNER